MRFTVDESKWIHGEGSNRSCLLRESDGKMCCVGFFCLAGGASKNSITSRRGIEDVVIGTPLPLFNPNLMRDIYQTNDQKGMRLDARKRRLGVLFTQMGHTILFKKGVK